MFSRLFNGNARKFDGIDFMELIPGSLVEFELDPDGQKVILMVPRYTDPIFGRLVQPFLTEGKRFIRLPLDPRGSWIWRQMDGQSNVGRMVVSFEAEFPDDQEGVPERLSGYLYNMWENKFLGFSNLEK